MVTAEQVLSFLRGETFVPFRIELADGSSYLIDRRYQCITSDHMLLIGIPHPHKGYMIRSVDVPLSKVARLTPDHQVQPA